jgi:hypothetical protein
MAEDLEELLFLLLEKGLFMLDELIDDGRQEIESIR